MNLGSVPIPWLNRPAAEVVTGDLPNPISSLDATYAKP